MKVLVTGGAGFIGSHVCVALLNAGHEVVIFDDLSNSHEVVIQRINKLAEPFNANLRYMIGDIRVNFMLDSVVKNQGPFDAVIHLAGLKAVAESIEKPLDYYATNISGVVNVMRLMARHKIPYLLFSSSATIYDPTYGPCFHTSSPPTYEGNPYSFSKAVCEQMIWDANVHNIDHVGVLRYFNPVGAHPTGLIGEAPVGSPNNLMPILTQTAIGKRTGLKVFGNDYAGTADGTPARDYIHVMDLAEGHVQALEFIASKDRGSRASCTFNFGLGKPVTVLEMIDAFQRVNNIKLEYTIVGRRAGDVACSYADISMAKQVLGWKPKYTLEDMCRDAWNFQQKNPEGYSSTLKEPT